LNIDILPLSKEQGWARDVKARDRDETRRSPPETETKPRRWLHQPRRDVKISRQDRDETFVAFETWSRR